MKERRVPPASEKRPLRFPSERLAPLPSHLPGGALTRKAHERMNKRRA